MCECVPPSQVWSLVLEWSTSMASKSNCRYGTQWVTHTYKHHHTHTPSLTHHHTYALAHMHTCTHTRTHIHTLLIGYCIAKIVCVCMLCVHWKLFIAVTSCPCTPVQLVIQVSSNIIWYACIPLKQPPLYYSHQCQSHIMSRPILIFAFFPRLGRNRFAQSPDHITEELLGLCWSMTSQGTYIQWYNM